MCGRYSAGHKQAGEQKGQDRAIRGTEGLLYLEWPEEVGLLWGSEKCSCVKI